MCRLPPSPPHVLSMVPRASADYSSRLSHCRQLLFRPYRLPTCSPTSCTIRVNGQASSHLMPELWR